MKKVAIYIRVSTLEQANEGYSIEVQKEKLISFAKAKDWNIYDIYVDGGFSGSNLVRPAVEKLMNNLDKIDIVLVYKLDRLSRSQKDTLYLIEEKFIKNNIDFVSLQESFDTSSAFGRAMIGILSVFAQLERETINERTKMGKDARAKEGLWKGGPTPVGYDYIDGFLQVNEYEAMQVRKIFDLATAGKGANSILDTLIEQGYYTKYGKWRNTQASVIRNILSNKTYIGFMNYGGKLIKGQHEPIISKDFFEEVEKIRNSLYQGKKEQSKYLLSGLIWCGDCSSRLFGNISKSKYKGKTYEYPYYVCYSRYAKNKYMIKSDNCKLVARQMDKLEKEVYSKLKDIALNRKALEEVYSGLNQVAPANDNLSIENKIKEIDKQINKLMDLYQFNTIPANILSERIEKLYKEKKQLESQVVVEEVIQERINFEMLWESLQDFEEVWQEATFEEKKVILNSFINKIIVHNDDVEIEWSFL